MLILKTPRLLLREFTISDAPFIIDLLNTPGWLANIGDKNVKTLHDAEAYLLNGPINSYKMHGFGLWAVIDEVTNQPIGMCGLLKRDTLDHPDVGYALLPQFTGMGYACEITSAVLKHGFEACNLTHITAITLPDNTASVNLLKKLGMHFEKNVRLQHGGDNLQLFGIVESNCTT